MASGASRSNLRPTAQDVPCLLRCRMLGERHAIGQLAFDLAAGHEAIVIRASIVLRPEDTIARFPSQLRCSCRHGNTVKVLFEGDGAVIPTTARARSSLPRRSTGAPASAGFLSDPFNLAPVCAVAQAERRDQRGGRFCEEDAASLEASHEALQISGFHKVRSFT